LLKLGDFCKLHSAPYKSLVIHINVGFLKDLFCRGTENSEHARADIWASNSILLIFIRILIILAPLKVLKSFLPNYHNLRKLEYSPLSVILEGKRLATSISQIY
jgi:hypothetical protein